MPDVTPAEPLPEFPHPPIVLGLRWHSSRMLNTRRGPRRLSRSGRAYVFDDVWSSGQGQRSLRAIGFDCDGVNVLHWGGETPIDPDEVAEILRKVDLERVAEQAEARRIRERLQHEVDAHWWAVPAERLRQAQYFVGQSVLSRSDLTKVDALADLFVEAFERAGRAVVKARDSLTSDDLARCESTEVRAAVHEACQVLSLADDDRAAVNNRMGWSKSTSHRGHWLSELPELDAGLAAVGMMLVHRHRRQLRPDLREALFPTVSRRAA